MQLFISQTKAWIAYIERSIAELDRWYGEGIQGLRADYCHELGVRRAILANLER